MRSVGKPINASATGSGRVLVTKAVRARQRGPYCTCVQGRHESIALLSALDTQAQRLARSASTVAAPGFLAPETWGSGLGVSRQNQWGQWNCQWRPGEVPHWEQRRQSPLGAESTGIHSPWRVCHCKTPPTSRILTLLQTKLSPSEVVSKRFSGFFQSTVLLCSQLGTPRRTCVTPGICRLRLVDAIPCAPRQLFTRVHHVVGHLTLELD